jgi:hypothetical protein
VFSTLSALPSKTAVKVGFLGSFREKDQALLTKLGQAEMLTRTNVSAYFAEHQGWRKKFPNIDIKLFSINVDLHSGKIS